MKNLPLILVLAFILFAFSSWYGENKEAIKEFQSNSINEEYNAPNPCDLASVSCTSELYEELERLHN
jgi:hypothetical protein